MARCDTAVHTAPGALGDLAQPAVTDADRPRRAGRSQLPTSGRDGDGQCGQKPTPDQLTRVQDRVRMVFQVPK